MVSLEVAYILALSMHGSSLLLASLFGDVFRRTRISAGNFSFISSIEVS